MKTIEQKARAYDEALERARKVYNNISPENSSVKKILEKAFPELSESEDEKSKKWILEYLHDGLQKSDEQFKDHFKAAIAWLEKHGEKKSADNTEIKFNVGEWVVNKFGDAWHIDSFDEKNYQVSDGIGNYNYFPIAKQDEMRHWILADAKDGDVLVYGDNPNDHHVEIIMLFKSTRSIFSAFTHFHIYDDVYSVNDWCDCRENAHPATKEQRDLFFKKMQEAGYEWNPEKKELKKIENRPLLSDFFNAEYERGKADALKYVEWSEEDEKNISTIRIALRDAKLDAPQEFESYGREITVKDFENAESWLKSIKDRVHPQNRWNPSKEQMEALKASYFYWKGITKEIPYAEKLESLYEQLKKLTE